METLSIVMKSEYTYKITIARAFIFAFALIAISGTTLLAQKPKAVSKPTNPRSVAPPNRQFNHRFTIDFSYDKFEDRTKVQMRLPVNTLESVHFAYFFKGEKLKVAPTDVIFMFFKDKDREFLFPVTDFVVLTDRDRMRLKMVEAKDLIIDGKNPYTAKLDYKTFLQMANAKKLDLKIGDFEITFDDESMEALKDFASRTSPMYRESKSERESEEVSKNVQIEADRLRRMSVEKKTVMREVLVAAKSSMLLSLSNEADDIKQASVAGASQIYLENKESFSGDFAILIDEVVKALVRSDILRGIKNGTINRNQFDTKAIVDEYGLNEVLVDQRPNAILNIGNERLDMLLRISSEAGIID